MNFISCLTTWITVWDQKMQNPVFYVIIISNTRKSVSSHFQTPRRELKIWSRVADFRGVWTCDKTLSRVFDTSSQSKLKLPRKQRNKKSMLIKIRFQTTVTVLISFVLTRWIINEFEKEHFLQSVESIRGQPLHVLQKMYSWDQTAYCGPQTGRIVGT